MMHSGVIYRRSRALFTMKGGRWTPHPDLNEVVIQDFPQEATIIEKDSVDRRKKVNAAMERIPGYKNSLPHRDNPPLKSPYSRYGTRGSRHSHHNKHEHTHQNSRGENSVDGCIRGSRHSHHN